MKELDEWEKRLRDQVRGWKDPLPPDGWQRLSRMLPESEAARPRKVRRRRYLLALPAAAAAAAMLLLVLPPRNDGEGAQEASAPAMHRRPAATLRQPAAGGRAATASARAGGTSRLEAPVRFAPAVLPRPADADGAPADAPAPAIALMAFAAPSAAADSTAARDAAPAPAPQPHTAAARRKAAVRKAPAIPEPAAPSAAPPRFTLSVESGPAAGLRRPGYLSAPDGLLAAGSASADEQPTVNPVVGENLRRPTASRIRHRLPLQFTAGIDFPLTARLTLGTGISYTRLTTDVEGGSTYAFYHTRQRLHYIGVPLRIAFTFARTPFAHFYASAEARIALCVGARQETDFRVEDSPAPASTTAHDGRGLWQGSFTVAAGAELRLGRRTGLFLEPGATYALPDGSSLPTPYHDNPLRFSLQAGLRWKLR